MVFSNFVGSQAASETGGISTGNGEVRGAEGVPEGVPEEIQEEVADDTSYFIEKKKNKANA